MNWGRAKTILIIMFLAIDILLLCLFAVINNDINYIKEDTVNDTVSVLNSRDIKVSKEQIPKKRVQKKIVNYENLLYNPKKAARRFLGESYETMQESEAGNQYKNGNMTVSIFGGEMTVTVERTKKPAATFEDVKKELLKDLESFGYKKNDIGFEKAYVKDGVCHVTAYQKFEKLKVNGTEIALEADAEGLLNLSGRCFSFTDSENTKEMLTDVTSALVNMIYDPACHGIEIKEIEVMYYIASEYIDASNVTAYPVYVVKDTKNREYILE